MSVCRLYFSIPFPVMFVYVVCIKDVFSCVMSGEHER
jgi:hypothetical protein